jgi:hypothetical protein
MRVGLRAAQVMLHYYECLPDAALEGLQHDCDFDCPKARAARPAPLQDLPGRRPALLGPAAHA